MTHFGRVKRYVSENRNNQTLECGTLFLEYRRHLRRNGEWCIKVKKEWLVYPYIIDIAIPSRGIAIEVDGGIHESRIEYDSRRDSFLESLGLLVLRFSNEDIKSNLNQIVEFLDRMIFKRASYSPSGKIKSNNFFASDFSKTDEGRKRIPMFNRFLLNH